MPGTRAQRRAGVVDLGPSARPPGSDAPRANAALEAGSPSNEERRPRRLCEAKTSDFERVRNSSFDFLADNEFIHTGYRHGGSFRDAFLSLFQLHNETGNTLSHLLGAILFLGLLVHILTGGLQADYQKAMYGGREMLKMASSEMSHFREFARAKLGIDLAGTSTHTACTVSAGLGENAVPNSCHNDPAVELRAAFESLRETLASTADHAVLQPLHRLGSLAQGAGQGAASWAAGVVGIEGNGAQHGGEAFDSGPMQSLSEAVAGTLRALEESMGSAYLHLQQQGQAVDEMVGQVVDDSKRGFQSAVGRAEGAAEHVWSEAVQKLGAVHAYVRQATLEAAHRLKELKTASGGGSPGGGAQEAATQALQKLVAELSRAWGALEAAGEGSRHAVRMPPVYPLAVFAASALICLGTSATFHLLHVVDRKTFELLARADYVGIAILIAGSLWPPVIYAFPCPEDALYQYLYLGLTALFASATVVLGMLDAFRTPEWRVVRASAFVCAGGTGVFPLAHMFLFTSHLNEGGQQGQLFRQGLWMLLLMGVQYLGGALIYAQRIPERWLPGKFDLLFQSHFIFHCCVVGACIAHWVGSLAFFQWSTGHECPAPAV